jgi:hypothetical protein
VTYVPESDEGILDPPTGSSLRDVIVAQGLMETGIFVLLFTSDTVEPTVSTQSQSAALVDATADRLGVDRHGLKLYSPDAYLVQAALGEAVLDQLGAAPEGEQA